VATAPITTDPNPCRTSSVELRLRRLELAGVDQPLIEAPAQDSGISACLTRQPEPPALVLNNSSCYHFRAIDPPRCARLSATTPLAIIGHCYHI
jgi:hypothetical protein